MRDHKKIKAVRSKFGIMGFGVWVMVLEYLTGNDGNVFEYSDMEFELMSGDFGVSATEIKSIVDYCISLELLFNVGGFVKSESLDERLLPVYEKRGKAKELSKKQQRENGKFTRNNTDETVIYVTETPQSKVKESTENESKGKENIFQDSLSLLGIDLSVKKLIDDEYWKHSINHLTKGKDLGGAVRSSFAYLESQPQRFKQATLNDLKKVTLSWLENKKPEQGQNGVSQKDRLKDL